MRTLAIVTFALVGIGMVLVVVIVADSAGATRADAEGYAQTIAVNRSVTPATIIAKEQMRRVAVSSPTP
jgi:hypothetical protein